MRKHVSNLCQRVLSLLLALVLCLGVFPLPAIVSAEETTVVDVGDEQTNTPKSEQYSAGDTTAGKDAGIYYQDFSTAENVDNWMLGGDNGKIGFEDGKLSLQQVNTAGSAHAAFYDNSSPLIENGFVETVMTAQQRNRTGIAFRYQDANRFAAICYDEWNGWQWSMGGGSYGYLGVKSPAVENGQPIKVRVEFEGAHIKIILNDKPAYEGDIAALDIGAGKLGARMWGEAEGGGHAHFDYFKYGKNVVSTVTPNQLKIAEEQWGVEDVTLTMNLGAGDSLMEIKNGEAALVEGEDYTVEDSTVTIKSTYFTDGADRISLTFNFALSASAQVTLLKNKAYEAVEYSNNFMTLEGLVKKSGSGSFSLDEDGSLRIQGETVLVDENSPVLTDGEVEFVLEPMNDRGGFGLVFRANGDDWTGFQCVDTRRSAFVYAGWNLKTSDGVNDMIWDDSTIPMSMREYKIKFRFEGNVGTLYVDGQEAYTFETDKLNAIPGQIGIMTMGQTDVKIKELSCRSLQPLDTTKASEEQDVILSSDEMTVKLDGAFPRVLEYNMAGKTMYGQVEPKYYAMVNAVNYPATAVVGEKTDTSVTYRVTVEEAAVAFNVVYTLSGASLKMEINNIDETNTRVYSLGFPENCMISVKSTQNGAKLDAAVPWKPLNQSTVDDVTDAHYDLSRAVGGSAYKYANIPIFTADGLSASMVNTLVKNLQEFAFQSFTTAEGETYTGAWSTEFVYRGWGFGDEGQGDPVTTPVEELSCTVVLTQDRNDDKIVDWQDGALALNTVRDPMPGSDRLQDSFVHIAMNFASGAQQPFLRIGDNLKKVYLATDGFGQMLIIKGYNSEGHDSGHSEASDVNMRAGGAKDFQTLAENAKNYNAYVGGHVNVSNMFPEAETWDPRYAAADNHTWGGWLDNGCDIKRENFISDGLMDKEFNELSEQVPDMGLAYLDTFVDYRFAAYRICENFKEHGWTIFNENRAMLDKYCSWVHWPGVSSTIHRFVHHQEKDVYTDNNLLWGGRSPNDGGSGFMSWQHRNDYNGTIRYFFTTQLPYRYLMNHELLKLGDNEAIFAGGVRTTSDKKIYKDDKLIANGNGLLFIPWFDQTEEGATDPDDAYKIYHWNSQGGPSTWDLPDSWSGQTEVKLYRLTDTGKTDEKTLKVEDGKVTIDAQANTPYVLYKGNENASAVEVTDWSYGSAVKDASFISHTFDSWIRGAENAESISIQHTNFGKCYLSIDGAADSEVTQTITLTPGQKYEISVWAEVGNGKQAVIEVDLPDGTKVSNYMDESPLVNGDLNSALKNTKYLRMAVIFTMPAGSNTTATLHLKGLGGSDNGYAHFTDVRAVESTRPELEEGYILNEDFENVSEGWGPFYPTGTNIEKIHLSETNEGYTTDTLDGHWSLKCKGNGMRTVPFTLRFEPTRKYVIEFLSNGGGTITIRNESGSEVLLNESMKDGANKFEFTTGSGDDYYIRLDSPQILDNIKVYSIVDTTPPTTPENLTATLDQNKVWVNLTWDAASDADSGVSGYKVYRDGVLLATVGNTTTYTDKATVDETKYVYSVSAVNGGGTEGEKSEEASVTTGILAPVVENVTLLNPTTAVVAFNKSMDKTSAETVSNYQITNSQTVTITRAVLSADGKQVTLSLRGLTASDSVVLQIGSVKDSTGEASIESDATYSLTLLAHYYKLDEVEGTTYQDEIGDKDGTKSGNVTVADGKEGKAADFSSGGASVDLPNDVLNGLEEYTLTTWIKWNGAGSGSQTIFSNNSSGNRNSPGVWLRLNDGTITADNLNGGSVNSGSTKVAANEWAHVAVVRRIDGTDLYVNGELVGTGTATIRLGDNGTHIGRNSDNKGWYGHDFHGAIDEFKIFKTALNAAEVAEVAGLGHTHAYTVRNYDETNHWMECACGEKDAGSVEAHTFGEGVLNEDGTKYTYTCTVCGYEKTEDVEHEHDYTVRKYDETNHWMECACGEKDAGSVEAHTFGEGVLNEDGTKYTYTCTVCGYEKTEDVEHEHDYTVRKYDETNHWLECACGERDADSVEAHTFGEGELNEDGTKYTYTCTVCGYEKTEDVEPPEVVHVTSVTLNRENVTLTVSESMRLYATVSPEDADNREVHWASSNPTVARVSDDGTIVALRRGQAIITVTTEDGGYTDTCVVNVRNRTILPILPSDPKPVEPSEPEGYYDVSVGDWYYDAVSYVTEEGLMTGVGNGKFNPDGAVTRAMVWTVLARMDGENTDGGATWYSKAQSWAMRTGVSDGTNPMGSITREQLAAMLYRYEGSPAVSGNLGAYPDANTVSDWAVDAMVWATEEGIINGMNGHLKPQDGATRAQLAAMLQRFVEIQ